MKFLRHLVVVSAILAALPAQAQITAFTHIVVIVQENRTPDNLFWELCQQATCDTRDLSKYDIKTDKWDNYGASVTPLPFDLAVPWDVDHLHNPDWLAMCHFNQAQTACQMDGPRAKFVFQTIVPLAPPFRSSLMSSVTRTEWTFSVPILRSQRPMAGRT